MQKIYYQASGWLKHAEEDSFENGCIPETAQSHGGNHVFKGNILAQVVNQCREFCGSDSPEDVLLDSCDEIGRLDIQIMENADGYPATAGQMERFKEGKQRLWLCTYSFYIEKIIAEPVELSGLELK